MTRLSLHMQVRLLFITAGLFFLASTPLLYLWIMEQFEIFSISNKVVSMSLKGVAMISLLAISLICLIAAEQRAIAERSRDSLDLGNYFKKAKAKPFNRSTAFVLLIAQSREQVDEWIKFKGYAPAVAWSDEVSLWLKGWFPSTGSKPTMTVYALTDEKGPARDVYQSVRHWLLPGKIVFLTDYMWVHGEDGWECFRSRY